MELKDITAKIREFRDERDWAQFHNPKDMAIAISIEASELHNETMNRRIPNGSWCLFREPSDGSRNGKVVIVQSRDIQDPDTGGQYKVKVYRGGKAEK